MNDVRRFGTAAFCQLEAFSGLWFQGLALHCWKLLAPAKKVYHLKEESTRIQTRQTVDDDYRFRKGGKRKLPVPTDSSADKKPVHVAIELDVALLKEAMITRYQKGKRATDRSADGSDRRSEKKFEIKDTSGHRRPQNWHFAILHPSSMNIKRTGSSLPREPHGKYTTKSRNGRYGVPKAPTLRRELP